MSHHDHDTEGRPRESYPNPTQERMDEEGPSDAPADASWDEGRWGETDAPHEEQEPQTLRVPHEGVEGQQDDAA
jgi:hypothetical protein